MPESYPTHTTDLSAPTPSEMDEMCMDYRAAELAQYERIRRAAVAPISERADADEALAIAAE